DIDDYLSYELCLTAPPDEPPDAVCLAFHDFDVAGESDGRVDLDDFGGLLNCFRGSGQTPPPECFRPAPAGEVPGSGSFALHGSMVDVLSGGRGPGDELALQYSRARYFDLKHGRFLQRDPKGYIDGANLYEAFGSNPARFTDPMGTLTLEWHMRITLAAMDQTEFAPPANGVFRTAILIGSLYPDVPLQEVQTLVGREMDTQTVLTVVDAYNKNWFVRAYRSVGATIADYCVPDILLDNCVSNDIRDWWNSTSFVDPAINAAAWAWPEVEDTLMYRTHKGDLQWWHGMAEGGTAEAMNRKLLARMLLPVAEYRGSPANPNAGFLIGNALHTVQDLYTPPHVERDPDGLIIRHQDYAAQSSVYHAEKDVLDLNKPEDRDLYYTLVNRSALYLSALQEYRAGNLDETRLKRLLRESYLTAVPGGPAMGGTASQYAPRPSVTGEVIDATGRAARWTYNQGVRAYRWAGNIYERVNQWWNE
ncbi:MAG: hypothetical protein LC118_17910, partial [Dehalococcoidia bacterium]|nr:hypothetical protein [Dehalococcoidia bacterium]